MSTRYHFWLTGVVDGKPFLIYGAETENRAREKGLEELSGIDFTIKRLPTRNIEQASRLLKGYKLEKTRDLRTATKRLKHKRIKRRSLYD